MFKKTLILVCLLMIGMNLSAGALPQNKGASQGKLVEVQSRPSKAELQQCVKEARAYIANLRKMGYSTLEINRIVAQQIGVTTGLTQDFYEGHVTTQKMWTLLISAVVISSVVGVVGMAAGIIGDMNMRNYLARQESDREQTAYNEPYRGYTPAYSHNNTFNDRYNTGSWD